VQPAIDVVIPVYGHYELTRTCLQALAVQTVPHGVIIVDDGSEDDSLESLRREWPDVTVIALGSNQGYTSAVNRGVEAGKADYVILLNNDVRLRRDCLQRLVAPLRADAGVGSVASLMLTPDGTTIDSVGVTADITLAGFARLQGHHASEASASEPLLTGPEGTAAAYRRGAWEGVGGLDENIRAYMEILDLALRLRVAGWRATSAPDAVGVHLGSRTYGRRSARQRRLAGFSRGYLLRRYGVLSGRAGPRALTTEALVVTADAIQCRDLEALRGRLDGWRAGAGLVLRERPPAEALDSSITFRRSLALRRGALTQAGG
jgi:N-acetylglucosaminyl-diphospho-decaprenol L-rhamnosyltransferase